MSGAEVAALGWLAAFIRSLTTTILGDRLKRTSSSERARVLAYRVYQALAELEEQSKDFVAALAALADGNDAARHPLTHRLQVLSKKLRTLERALRSVDPQLSIHAPDVVAQIRAGSDLRWRVISSADGAVGHFEDEASIDFFKETHERAKASLREIEAATAELRSFLANEFSFKDSF